MVKCGYCQAELEPTPNQLGAIKKGFEVFCVDTNCRLKMTIKRNKEKRLKAKFGDNWKDYIHKPKRALCKNKRCKKGKGGKRKQFYTSKFAPKHDYCCPSCRIIHRRDIQKAESKKQKTKNTRERNKELRKKARIFASLHCIKYRECLYGNKLKCLNCVNIEVKQNAYRMELSSELNHDVDEYPLRLTI